MRVGFIGVGKLGLPVSLVYASKGHELLCYDVNMKYYEPNIVPLEHLCSEEKDPQLKGSLREWLQDKKINLRFVDLETVLRECEIVFVAVQTPHHPKYEGNTRIPDDRIDFDYSFLKSVMKRISDECVKDTPIVIISTVLPGTIRREILPLLSDKVQLCYNPYFIAMGTVASDCLNPEFILVGNHNPRSSEIMIDFYKTICDCPVFSTSIENAEMIKVSYNTFITTKTVLGNTIMDLCSRLPGTDCDTVLRGLTLGTRRIMSPAYLKGGMGDGGGCHPRDNIALSWLSRNVGLHYDYYECIMKLRESQCETIANKLQEIQKDTGLQIWLFGTAFKPDTSIETGSSALLLGSILHERDVPFFLHDPHTNRNDIPTVAVIACISCAHSTFLHYTFVSGTVLVDPHRLYANCNPKGKYIPLGVSI
jgi:UDPglucose 6-dehydrogenase